MMVKCFQHSVRELEQINCVLLVTFSKRRRNRSKPTRIPLDRHSTDALPADALQKLQSPPYRHQSRRFYSVSSARWVVRVHDHGHGKISKFRNLELKVSGPFPSSTIATRLHRTHRVCRSVVHCDKEMFAVVRDLEQINFVLLVTFSKWSVKTNPDPHKPNISPSL